ncbi:hypothetical protein PMAYCL1PPCAC_04373, partial [Pristionchus mayeri]
MTGATLSTLPPEASHDDVSVLVMASSHESPFRESSRLTCNQMNGREVAMWSASANVCSTSGVSHGSFSISRRPIVDLAPPLSVFSKVPCRCARCVVVVEVTTVVRFPRNDAVDVARSSSSEEEAS